MRRTLGLTVAVVLLLVACVPIVVAQGTYTQIDYPGAAWTACYGINTAGDVVGVYVDTNNKYHGFHLSGGVYTSIDYRGAHHTEASGINDLGQIVGWYKPDAGGVVGYLYDLQTQAFTKISYAGAKKLTQPLSINNDGIIVGIVFANNRILTGFELNSGTFQRLVPSNFNSSVVGGISNSGEAVGCGISKGRCVQAFSFNQEKFQRVKLPRLYQPFGVNIAHAIVGGHQTKTGQQAFLYQNDILQELVFPGSIDGAAAGINDAGVVVGGFDDSSFISHGFIWTPPGGEAKNK
jgi:uncharacterized membrane protein